MSKFTFALVGLMSFALALASASAGIVAPAMAQTNTSGDNRDPFSRAATGDTGGLMQLLHGVQTGAIRNNAEFERQQQQQVSSSTASFRAEQLRRLRAQQQKPQTTKPTP
jgi:hypothetical protein